MKKFIVFLLVLLSLSISIYATSEKGTVFMKMDETVLKIGFFSNKSVYDYVLFLVLPESSLSESAPLLVIGKESSNDEMESTVDLYKCKELFSDNELYLLYDVEGSSENAMESKNYLVFSPDTFFNMDIPDTERDIIDNSVTKEFVRGILEANNVLILIQKLDVPTRTFRSVKLIDIPLDKDECAEALKKLEAFERIP